MLVISSVRRSAPMVVWVAAAAVAVLVTLLIAPAANAQLAICSRVSPPPSYCNEEPPDEPPPPAPTPAAAPTELVMSANTSSSITLAWTDNATNEIQFTVDKVVNGYWVPVTHLPANPGTGGMSTTIGDLPSNTSYKFRIFASPGSMSNGPMLEVATRPEAPANVTASASDTTINMGFTPPPSADRLIVSLRRDGTGTGAVAISAPIDARSWSYKFTGLTPSTQYCVSVTAEGPGGRSPSEPVCLKTDPPPPPPPPPASVTVPQTIGDTFLTAASKLQAVKLKVGNVTAPPDAWFYGDLPVVEQTPQSGTRVLEGTTVDLRVAWKKVSGVKGVTLANWHQDKRSVRIHIWDGWQWTDSGDLAWGQSKAVTLVSARVSTVVAVDRGLVGCVDGQADDGRPDNVSCQRMAGTYLGDSSGAMVDAPVY